MLVMAQSRCCRQYKMCVIVKVGFVDSIKCVLW